jgi:hypothetical protein
MMSTATRTRAPAHADTPPKDNARGWQPDPLDNSRLRFWTGESWSNKTRAWQAPSEDDEMGQGGREAVDPNALGLPLILAGVGALALLVSAFLPLYESHTFLRVESNTLIQQGIGWLFIGLAIGVAGTCYRIYAGRQPNWGLVVMGVIAIAAAIYVGTDKDLRTLQSANPSSILGQQTEVADPGVGVYVAGVGGLLVLVGGWIAIRASDTGGRAARRVGLGSRDALDEKQ